MVCSLSCKEEEVFMRKIITRFLMSELFIVFVMVCASGNSLSSQEMTIEDYDPRTTLISSSTRVTSARYPFVDIHGHQRATTMSSADVQSLVQDMDDLNMACLLYTSPSPRDRQKSRMPSSA